MDVFIQILSWAIGIGFASLAFYFYKAKNGMLRKIIITLFASLAWSSFVHTLCSSNWIVLPVWLVVNMQITPLSNIIALSPLVISIIFLTVYLVKFNNTNKTK